MGFLDRFKAEAKESALSQAIIQQYATGQAVWTPDNYEALAKKGYRLSPYVFACVDRLARGAAGVPLVLYRAATGREGKARAIQERVKSLPPAMQRKELKAAVASGDIEEIREHPMLTLLNRPNDLYGGAALIEASIAYRCLAGNTYWEGVGPDRPDAPPVELYCHRPDRMQVVVGTAQEPVQGYQYSVGGVVKTLPASAVMHWKTFNPLDDWYGMPPLVAAARSMDQNNSGREWNSSLMQNSARPSGLLLIKGASAGQPPAAQSPGIPDATTGVVARRSPMQALVDEVRNWMGSGNAGRPGILGMPQGVDISWQQTAFTPLEVSWMEGLALSAREICIVFNVPSLLIGDTESKTYANYAEARKALYQDGIFPLLDGLVSELNRWLTPKFGAGLFLGYDTDAVDAVQEDRNKAHERARKGWEAGLLSHDEARQAIGYGANPDHEGRYIWEVMPNRGQATQPAGKPDPDEEDGDKPKD